MCVGLAGCERASTEPATQPASAPAPTPGTVVLHLTADFTRDDRKRPDPGALVLLMPAAFTGKLGKIGLLENDAPRPEYLQKAGAYVIRVGTDGTAKIAVPPGSYRCLMFSEHNWAGGDECDANRKRLEDVIEDAPALSRKALVEDRVEVKAGKEIRVERNFPL